MRDAVVVRGPRRLGTRPRGNGARGERGARTAFVARSDRLRTRLCPGGAGVVDRPRPRRRAQIVRRDDLAVATSWAGQRRTALARPGARAGMSSRAVEGGSTDCGG